MRLTTTSPPHSTINVSRPTPSHSILTFVLSPPLLTRHSDLVSQVWLRTKLIPELEAPSDEPSPASPLSGPHNASDAAWTHLEESLVELCEAKVSQYRFNMRYQYEQETLDPPASLHPPAPQSMVEQQVSAESQLETVLRFMSCGVAEVRIFEDKK